MMKNKCLIEYRVLILIIISTLINILWIFMVKTRPYTDFLYYHKLAVEISKGGLWGDTYTAAGYSAILGFVYRIFGAKVIIAKLFNVFCTGVCNITFYLILKKCNIPSKYIFYSILIFSVYPATIMYNSILANEIIFTVIIMFILYIHLTDMRGKYVVEGVFIAAASMMKPFFIVFGFCIFVIDLMTITFNKRDLKKVLSNNLICLITTIVCISPWVVRNTFLMGELTFISNNEGIVLYINNNSDNLTGKWMPAESVTNSVTRSQSYVDSNATEKNKMLKNAAKQWILAHPKRFIELGCKRIFNTFYKVDDIDYALNGIQFSDKLQYYLTILLRQFKSMMSNSLALFLLVNVVYCIQNKKGRKGLAFKLNVFIIVITLFFSSVYFIAEGQGRYSFPLNFACAYSFSFFIGWFAVAIKKSFMDYKQLLKLYRTS